MSQARTLSVTAIAALAFVGAVLFVPFSASAQEVEKTDGFVCPVFNDESAVGEKNPNAVGIADGDYTIVGPEVSIPARATNQDGDGMPGGEHASPGDTDYTAIWGG